jgi:hypothetical protein
MHEDLKLLISENKHILPIISQYWEIEEPDKQQYEKYSNFVVSIKHHTSKYHLYSFYKQISNTIDLSYYSESEI